jgi:exodeoxyribonuclease VII large subunit
VTTRVISVGALTAYIKELLESDRLLEDIWLEGEVSNMYPSPAGHWYFSLKDEQSQLKCVVWRSLAARQRHFPRNGEQISIHGRISVYEPQGNYQLLGDVILPAGIGILAMRLEQLRQRLDAEGLFDESRKRPLPEAPKAIGVVTSASGSVWHDIQNVIRRRYPFAELILSPTPVQGDQAPEGIAAAIARLQEVERVEVIIVARGGGSLEDLFCFNDERVVRAIFASRVPVITGIGHETDVTLADLVADLRAPTPSAAAELAVPSIVEMVERLTDLTERAGEVTQDLWQAYASALDLATGRLRRQSPAERVRHSRDSVDALSRRIRQAERHRIAMERLQLRRLHDLLQTLEPEAMLRRGYARLSLADSGRPVNRQLDVRTGDRIRADLLDGAIIATVQQTMSSAPEKGTA